MLNQIKPSRSAHESPEDAVDLLIGCHQRIRHFTAAAVKLAHAQGASDDEVRQAAAAVYRYYSVSLPLHEADEEDTVRPRLDPVAGERVRHALLAMADQHQGIYDFVERLMPLLQLLEQNPGALPQVGGEMCSLTSALDEIFRAHLELEEAVIFPAIRETLPDSVRSEMLAEMQQRRKQG
jgi:iron-sulfur cluster repair protein YtfE (RIC family)